MFKKITRFAIYELVYGGHLQSLSAVCIVYVFAYYYLNVKPELILLLTVYLFTQFVNLFDRYRDLNSDAATNVERTLHLNSYKSGIPYLLLVLFFLCIALIVYTSNIKVLMTTLIIILLGVLYPIRLKMLTKRIPLFKDVVVSLVYASLVLYPIFYFSIDSVDLILILILIFFIFNETLINQIVLDIKDIKIDKKNKLLTLPVSKGLDYSLTACLVLSLFDLAFFGVSFHLINNIYFSNILILVFLINIATFMLIKHKRSYGFFISAAKFFVVILIILSIGL